MRKKIAYIGTYQKDYPRNRLIIEELRAQGHKVQEYHVEIFSQSSHAVHVVRHPLALLKFGLQLLWAYAKLAYRLPFIVRKVDELYVGYIGQFDMIFLWPFAKVFRKKICFNPLLSLYDTVVSDRELCSPTSILARVLWCIDWLSFRAADSLLIDTEAHKQFLCAEFSIPPAKVAVWPLGAESIFRPLSVHKSTKEQEECMVLFVGKFIPLQGLEIILRAASLLERAYPTAPLVFTLVGTGQCYKDMRQLAVSLGVQRVRWVDWIPYEDLPVHLNKADVCLGIFGSSDKAQRVVPNKVWQAAMCGRPVITRTMILPESDPRLRTVRMVEPTPQSLADAIGDVYQHWLTLSGSAPLQTPGH